jgi:hypothetical protein
MFPLKLEHTYYQTQRNNFYHDSLLRLQGKPEKQKQLNLIRAAA